MVKNLPANAGDMDSVPALGRSPDERNDNPLPVFLPGESHGQRSLTGYSPWGHKESDKTQIYSQKKNLIIFNNYHLFNFCQEFLNKRYKELFWSSDWESPALIEFFQILVEKQPIT